MMSIVRILISLLYQLQLFRNLTTLLVLYTYSGNPAHDEQAQDRAFRIGQNRDVDVLRLVSRGTIEELKYARQVYKVHLKQHTLENGGDTNVQPARLFRGVDSDKNRKGELFGSENLLKFKDGSFMDDLWKASESRGANGQIHVESEIAAVMHGQEDPVRSGFVTEAKEIVDSIGMSRAVDMSQMKGFNHEDFLREDRGTAALNLGDEGFDEELGGSQINYLVCENACNDIVDESDEEEALLNNLEQSLINCPSVPSTVTEEKEMGQNEGHQKEEKLTPDNGFRIIPSRRKPERGREKGPRFTS